MSQGLTSDFDRLHLSSLTDGDWRRDQQGMQGLARLTPFLYIGSDNVDDVTVEGYYNCATLAHFRVAVRAVRDKAFLPVVDDDGKLNPALEPRGVSGESLACPYLFDLDTRNLYLGQLNSDPAQQVPNNRLGQAIRGLPVRLQQVHFRAFNPQGQSDEYAAYFLCSNPVGPFGAYNSRKPGIDNGPMIDSDYALHEGPDTEEPKFWTYNQYTKEGPPTSNSAVRDFEGRMVIGNPLRVRVTRVAQDDEFADLAPMCPNPMNNCMEIVFDTEGFDVTSASMQSPQTARGWKYATPMSVVISNRYNFLFRDIDSTENPQSEHGKYVCSRKRGWTKAGVDVDPHWDPNDHVSAKLINECNTAEVYDLLLRKDPLMTRGVHDPLLSLGWPGTPTASAMGSLDGKNWEAAPMLQLEDFCNTPHVLPNDLMMIPVLENCVSPPVDGEATALTLCETTLGKVCLEDIAQYVIDYLFKVINNLSQDEDNPPLDSFSTPTRGIVTRVHATNCAIRTDFIASWGNRVRMPGEGLAGQTGIDGLTNRVCLNQEVIALTNCEENCSEEDDAGFSCVDTTYSRCNIADPLTNPYTVKGSCTPCEADDKRALCKDADGNNLPVGTKITACSSECQPGDGDDTEVGGGCFDEFIGTHRNEDGTMNLDMWAPNDSDAQTCTEERDASCDPEE